MLRNLEFTLPLTVQTPILRVLGNSFDPYDEVTRESESIFIHVPRVAGTSIAKALRRPFLHYPISRFAAFDPDLFRRSFKFAFVRNPWDRMLSGFSRLHSHKVSAETAGWASRHIRSDMSFEEFVLSLGDKNVRPRILSFLHFRPQLSWLRLPGQSALEMDFIGRFERLDEDFRALCGRLGVEATIERTNHSTHVPYRDAYTKPMREIVAELYRDDIETFDYAF